MVLGGRGSGLLATLEICPALVLNADFRPLSYFPLSLWSWQDAIKAIFMGRVDVVSEYDRVVRSPSFEFRLPQRHRLEALCPTRTSSRFYTLQCLSA